MVVTLAPSHDRASTAQDFTPLPSRCTVQHPHWLVSQPTCVPVSDSWLRRKSTSSVRGSTSALTGLPLTVIASGTATMSSVGQGAGAHCVLLVARAARILPRRRTWKRMAPAARLRDPRETRVARRIGAFVGERRSRHERAPLLAAGRGVAAREDRRTPTRRPYGPARCGVTTSVAASMSFSAALSIDSAAA